MKQVTITITALVPDDTPDDTVHRLAGDAEVQVLDPDPDLDVTTTEVRTAVTVHHYL